MGYQSGNKFYKTKKMKRARKVMLCAVSLLVLVAGAQKAWAQNTGTAAVKTPYYLDLNNADGKTVQTLQDEYLYIQYHDRHGSQPELALHIYNWKHEQVAAYALSKTFGLNHYTITLSNVFPAWKEGEVYSIEATDEARQKYSMPVRKIAPPENAPPEVSIFVNPIHIACADPAGNTVEFYGKIAGGKAPYTVAWYILNDARTGFLYQPREEVIKRPGNTMVVRVDKNPDYYVMLEVKDACGNQQRRMVNLVCEDEKKKINTVFLESIDPVRELPRAGN